MHKKSHECAFRWVFILSNQEIFYFNAEVLVVEMKNKVKRQTEKYWTVSPRQSSLTCFCSRALQWAASAVCWHPESRGGLWGPSAVEPAGETKQETSHELALPLGDVIHYFISSLTRGTKQLSHQISIKTWLMHRLAYRPGKKWPPPVNPFFILAIKNTEPP